MSFHPLTDITSDNFGAAVSEVFNQLLDAPDCPSPRAVYEVAETWRAMTYRDTRPCPDDCGYVFADLRELIADEVAERATA